MGKLDWKNRACAAVLLWATVPIGLSAQTFETVHRFDGTHGGKPTGALVQATSGNLYGTTDTGGSNNECGDGVGCGTVFEISPSGGPVKTLYSFCSQGGTACTDGANPQAGLVQGTGGNFYGTTVFGGTAGCAFDDGCGTVFKITPSGALTTLYRFCAQSGCTDGSYPSGLVQATDGNLHGTTGGGGANGGGGTVFRITPSATLTTLYSFCSESDCTDGADPAGLVQATDGNFYGTTSGGGVNGTDCGSGGCGTVFKITPSGTLTTLYSFCPQGRVCEDGRAPVGLVQDTNGMFYGTTAIGAHISDCRSVGCGTIFSLSVGLGPFVKTQPASARVGGFVEILGTNLTGATSVSFNGTPAVFRVVLNSLIKTTVPAGATTGTVEVVTPGGTLSSNVPFRVLP